MIPETVSLRDLATACQRCSSAGVQRTRTNRDLFSGSANETTVFLL